MSISKNLDENSIIFYCDFCFRDISSMNFIVCEECEMDLCIKCHDQKVETQCHKSNHSFRVVSDLDTVLEDKWSVLEYLLFINGLITSGIGNFADIALIIPGRKEAEIKRNFFEMVGIIDNCANETYVSSPYGNKSDPNDSDVVSYMSQRKEFDSEIINEYEALIQGIVDDENDSPTDILLKNHMLKYTQSVIKQRSIWKNFVIDRNLVNITEIKAKEKEDFGLFVLKYKWLLQFLSKNDFNVFLGSLFKEKKLYEKLSEASHNKLILISDLENVEKILSLEEKRFCRELNLDYTTYAKLKRLALECFLAKEPLKNKFFNLFEDHDIERAEVIFNWFLKNKIVVE